MNFLDWPFCSYTFSIFLHFFLLVNFFFFFLLTGVWTCKRFNLRTSGLFNLWTLQRLLRGVKNARKVVLGWWWCCDGVVGDDDDVAVVGGDGVEKCWWWW